MPVSEAQLLPGVQPEAQPELVLQLQVLPEEVQPQQIVQTRPHGCVESRDRPSIQTKNQKECRTAPYASNCSNGGIWCTHAPTVERPII